MTALRIVVGADDAGVEYKNIVRRDLEADDRVTSVIDVGVNDEGTAYAHIAVRAARVVAEGEAGALLVCGTGLGVAISANKVPVSAPSARTTASRLNARCCPTTPRCCASGSALSVSS